MTEVRPERAESDHPITWGGNPSWELEDKLGRRFVVGVEPLLADLYKVGDHIAIDGELFTVTARRGEWVEESA